MPRFNRTGPEGEGARTGRKMGNCSSENDSNRPLRKRGLFKQGRGLRNRRGNGMGQGNAQD